MLSRTEKIQRSVRFLLGLADPRVQAELVPHGFDQAALERARELVNAAVIPEFRPAEPAEQEAHLAELAEFQRRYYRIIKSALKLHHPKVLAWTLNRLPPVRGKELLTAIPILVERLRELEAGSSPHGKEGQTAMALLAARGLNDEVLKSVERTIEKAKTYRRKPNDTSHLKEQTSAAEALWAFYVEWSVIARTAITDRASLRALGFRQGVGRGKKAATAGERGGG